MHPGRAARLVTIVALASSAPLASAYVRNSGLLPEAKAKADAGRLVEVAKSFEAKRLKGKCVRLDRKYGLGTLVDLVNEEGRGYFPPRSGHEVALYRAMKDAIARGERLDPERVLEMSLEACAKDDEVSLQDALLTAHNVVRILARPETWWTNHTYSRGALVWTPAGEVELTNGRWEPGWRGMRKDSVFPIIEDIVGHAPVEGPGGRTLAEVRGATWDGLTPQQQEEHRREVEKRREEKRQALAAQRPALDRQKAERDRFAAEIEAARKALLGGGGGSVRSVAVRVGQMQDALGTMDAALREAEAAYERLRLEIEDDITGRARDPLYTRRLFAPGDDAAVSHLYGAEEDLGNGGNWYYFWLGAFVYATEGTGAEKLAARYEAAQKWLGSESEYARGLVQLSHFRGGAELGRQMWAHGKACGSEGLVEREYWDAEKTVLRREYQYVMVAGQKVRHGFERRYYRSGVLEYEATRDQDALEGDMTRYWENGAKFDVARYTRNHREGPYEAFFHEGDPRAKGQFKGGRKVGPWTTWQGKGVKEAEGSYLPDFYTVESVPWENRSTDDVDKGLYYGIGARTGRWTYWYPSGRRRLEEVYGDDGGTTDASGALVGPRREWYDNEANSPMSERLPTGASTSYHENGRLESRCDGRGSCERWNSQGERLP